MKENRVVQKIVAGLATFGLIAGTVAVAGADPLATIYDSSWTTFATDEDGTDPGGGDQLFDAEYLAYKLDGTILSIGIQTGFDLSDGHQVYSGVDYYAGDLALSFDNDASTYEYAIDFGFLTKDYSASNEGDLVGDSNDGINDPGLYDVSLWSNDIYYDTESSPFAMETGTLLSDPLTNTYTTGNPDVNSDDQSYFRYVSFNLTSLVLSGLTVADGFTIDAHWTMSCGNDNINGQFDVAPVPEPATMLLFGSGLAGLAGITRKRRKK